MAGKGREKSDNPKSKIVGIRLTKTEYNLLKNRASEHKLSLTQAVSHGIYLLYKEWGY